MINRLRKKLIVVTMLAVAGVMLLIFFALNVMNIYTVTMRADNILTVLSENDGVFPKYDKDEEKDNIFYEPIYEETAFESRYFYAILVNDTVAVINTVHIAAIDENDARKYIQEIIRSGRKNGYKGTYRYMVTKKGYARMIVFLDCRTQIQNIIAIGFISSVVGLACIFVIFVILFLVSKRVVRPMIENMDKQKQFITDAGHELKTPLAIIAANTEVLELCRGENEWTQSIKNQTRRMDKLVKNLLQLAKMDERSLDVVMSEFNMSETVKSEVEPFFTMAESKNRRLTERIEDNIMLNGDETGIKTLVSILVDNAIKYSSDGGEIKVTLEKNGKNIILAVRNRVDEQDENLNRMFDRFYRADSSRSRETGGFGIGLSIAKAVVYAHKGKISARNEENNMVCFEAVFHQ